MKARVQFGVPMRLVTRFCPLLVAVAALTSACDRPTEYGVSVFSTDTLPVTFSVTLTGSLALGLRSDGFMMQPDKSLLLTTPAQMTVSRGDGTARIVSVKGGPLAVQPLGVTDSTADTATVEGQVVMLTKPPEKRLVLLKAEKP
jgi:hypothetical protein